MYQKIAMIICLFILLLHGCQARTQPPERSLEREKPQKAQAVSFVAGERTKIWISPDFFNQEMHSSAKENFYQQQIHGFLPVSLEVPAIGLKTQVEPVGVLPNGQMGVPKNFDKVGILSPWTKPGEPGNAVIAGHLDHYTGPAVFFHLKDLTPGDKMYVADANGRKLTFTIREVTKFPTNEAPLDRIFGPATSAHLNLITCAGKYNRKTNEHPMRLVVFSELAVD